MIRLERAQWRVFRCDQRFRVLVAGRRFGKTYLALVELCKAAWGPGRLAWYVAPTYKMAKQIMWTDLLEAIPKRWIRKVNETSLKITLVNGTKQSHVCQGVHFTGIDRTFRPDEVLIVLNATIGAKLRGYGIKSPMVLWSPLAVF